MTEFIQCDLVRVSGQFLFCSTDTENAIQLTEQQVIDMYSPPFTPELGFAYAGVIFAVSLLSWGFKIALKQYNL